jgi:hypothetical protein
MNVFYHQSPFLLILCPGSDKVYDVAATASFIILQRKNPKLLFIMLTIFPLRIAWPEFMASIT